LTSLLGAIGGELTSVLPVYGIAGAETCEAGVVAALVPAGIGHPDALKAVGESTFLTVLPAAQRLAELLITLPRNRYFPTDQDVHMISGGDLTYVVANAGAAQRIWRAHGEKINICGATLRDWF